MKRSILRLAFFVPLLLAALPANAEVSVALTLDRSEAALNDSVRMVVHVSGAREIDTPPVIGGLKTFRVSRGGASTRVEIVNGRVTSGIDYTYFIQPEKTGVFRIGPARVTVGGKTFASATRALKVVASVSPREGGKGPLFLTASLSCSSAFVEEQVLYTLKLYRRVRVSDISLQLPEAEHLSFKQLGKPAEYQSVYEGRTYQVLEVRYALFAGREGAYGLGPARMPMTVHQSRQRPRFGFFDDPFLTTGRPVTLTSEALELKVLPLPEAGRPVDFSGLVGNFHIESTLQPTEVRQGESATLTARCWGP